MHHIYSATHCNSIVTLSKQRILHYANPLQLYNHNVTLMLLIFIHRLKFDMWHYQDFWIYFFLKY